MYADLDIWLALLKDDDWLADRATSLIDEYEDSLEVSLATLIELFLVEELRDVNRIRLEPNEDSAA